MSIRVNDFQWEPGKNDAEYIKLLESSRNEWQNLAQKAIAKLKALSKEQEPRVMTLEEYEAWIDTPFTERNPVFHEERTKRGAVTCWVNTNVCSLREYGKNDRCWTSRPTAEQREAEPWE